MSNTLIVRDAVALACGDLAGGAELEAHLLERVEITRSLPDDQVQECFDVLAPDAGDEAQAEVLAAALILTAAHPRAAAAFKLSPAVVGRRLAAAFERAEDVDFAFASLRVAGRFAPGNAGIERATASLMRRQGMVQELVDRYLDRAQRLLDEGEHAEAIPWLREVLALDRSRKDVARMIRDLRFDEVSSANARKRRVRIAGLALAVSLGLSFAALREVRLRSDFADLPQAIPGDVPSLNARLAAVEEFVAANPVWHGALGALQERSELRVLIERIVEDEAAKREKAETARERMDEMADGSTVLARRLYERGDAQGALDEFEKALSIASESWPQRERTERDIAALKEAIAEEGEE